MDEPVPGCIFGVRAIHLRGRESGVTVDEPCAWIIDHVDGRVTRFEPFLNRVEEARALAEERSN